MPFVPEVDVKSWVVQVLRHEINWVADELLAEARRREGAGSGDVWPWQMLYQISGYLVVRLSPPSAGLAAYHPFPMKHLENKKFYTFYTEQEACFAVGLGKQVSHGAARILFKYLVPSEETLYSLSEHIFLFTNCLLQELGLKCEGGGRVLAVHTGWFDFLFNVDHFLTEHVKYESGEVICRNMVDNVSFRPVPFPKSPKKPTKKKKGKKKKEEKLAAPSEATTAWGRDGADVRAQRPSPVLYITYTPVPFACVVAEP